MAKCFALGVNCGIFATVIHLSLSFQRAQRNTGSFVSIPNKPAVSFIRLINVINSHIEVDRAMYLLYVVLRVISVCIFLPK